MPNTPGIITSLIRFYLFWKFGSSPQGSPSYKPIPIWGGGEYEGTSRWALRPAVNCSPQFSCVASHGLEHSWWGTCEFCTAGCRKPIFLFFCCRSKTIGVCFPKCLLITDIKGQWPLLIYPHVKDHSLHPQSPYWWYWVKINLAKEFGVLKLSGFFVCVCVYMFLTPASLVYMFIVIFNLLRKKIFITWWGDIFIEALLMCWCITMPTCHIFFL